MRYQGHDLKDMMAAVLSHPAVRATYRPRQAIVEPCFAELRERCFRGWADRHFS